MADRLTEFQLVYDMSDVSAKEDASPWAQSYKYFDADLIIEDNLLDSRMTLEHNFCALDGTQVEFPDDTSDVPFFSEMTNINGAFLAMTYIGIAFTEQHSSYALTINFMDDYPLKLKCTWYRDNNVLLTKNYDVDSREFVIRDGVQNYNRIDIEFLQTIPRRYVKVNSIRFGMVINWDEKNLKSGNLTLELDPISTSLPASRLTFEVVDIADDTNPGNKEGLHNFFQRNQFMQPYEIVNGQRMKLGKYYLSDFTYNKNVCKINAGTVLNLLENTMFESADVAHPSQSFTPPSASNYVTATTWLERIFANAGIDSSRYLIDSSFNSVKLYFGIQYCTCKEALQQVLFASMAIADFTDSDYDIKIKPRTASILGMIPKSSKFSTSVKKTEYVSGVRINYNTIKWSSTDENNGWVINERLAKGTYIFDVDQPRQSYSGTQEQYGDFGYDGSTAFKLKVVVYRDNALVKIASLYIGEWKQESVQVNRDIMEAGEWTNVKEFNTTLCNKDTATQLAKDLLEYYNDRLEINIKNLVLTDHVGINEQFIIQNSTTGMDNYLGRYTQRNIDLVKGFIDNAKLIGAFDLSSAEYYLRTQDYELYTDNNEVI